MSGLTVWIQSSLLCHCFSSYICPWSYWFRWLKSQSPILALFQVREARVHPFIVFFCLSHCYIAIVCLVCWCEPVNGIVELFGTCCVLVHERTMVSTGFLAQASMSRLGEINRGSPKLLYARSCSGDPHCFWVSKRHAQAREVSPKQDHA